MFIMSSILLVGLVVSAVVTRLAQGSFAELSSLSYLPQEG
jgi:hypothetical protein